MATVEIHGATTFILVIFLILSVSSISQLYPPKTKFSAVPSRGIAAWIRLGTLEGQEGRVGPVSYSSDAGLYQLALTASISLTKF